jgi:hypothetical protein
MPFYIFGRMALQRAHIRDLVLPLKIIISFKWSSINLKKPTLSLSPSVSVARMTLPLFTEKITFYSGSSVTRASLNENSRYRNLFF